MNCITKAQIEKIVSTGNVNFPKGVTDETPILMRCEEISRIGHLNTVYKDGNKFYIEDSVDAEDRICRRAGVGGGEMNWDNASFCLYLSELDMQEAVKIFKRRYV